MKNDYFKLKVEVNKCRECNNEKITLMDNGNIYYSSPVCIECHIINKEKENKEEMERKKCIWRIVEKVLQLFKINNINVDYIEVNPYFSHFGNSWGERKQICKIYFCDSTHRYLVKLQNNDWQSDEIKISWDLDNLKNIEKLFCKNNLKFLKKIPEKVLN